MLSISCRTAKFMIHPWHIQKKKLVVLITQFVLPNLHSKPYNLQPLLSHAKPCLVTYFVVFWKTTLYKWRTSSIEKWDKNNYHSSKSNHDILKTKQKQKLKGNTNSYFYQKEFYRIHAASHFRNTPSTASVTPVQQACPVDKISDLPTLPNKNNVSFEEQLKQQQLLIDKLTNQNNALESHAQLLEEKVAIQKTVNNLLEQKTDDLEAYSRRSCAIVLGIQKPKEET